MAWWRWILVAACLVALWLSFWVSVDATTEVMSSFTVNVPFERFRKIMVRTNATQRIVDKSGMELKEQSTTGLGLKLDHQSTGRPLEDLMRAVQTYDIQSGGTIEVQPNDPFLDGESVRLKQSSRVTKASLDSLTTLEQPGQKLLDYQSRIQATPEGNACEVSLSIGMTIRAKTPLGLGVIARSKVRQAARSALLQQEQVLREIIAEHEDDLLILPRFGND